MALDPDNPSFQRSLLEHHVESLRLALETVDRDDVREVLRRLLEEREAELRCWPNALADTPGRRDFTHLSDPEES